MARPPGRAESTSRRSTISFDCAAASSAAGGSVAYNVIFNGGGVDLSTGAAVQVITGTGTTPATGTAFPIEFTIGTLSGNEAAGTYADVIDVEVTAN